MGLGVAPVLWPAPGSMQCRLFWDPVRLTTGPEYEHNVRSDTAYEDLLNVSGQIAQGLRAPVHRTAMSCWWCAATASTPARSSYLPIGSSEACG